MILKTARLQLRPWKLEDAEDLYFYAKNPRVGPMAGWPPHTSIEESLLVIKEVFSQPHIFAVTVKNDSRAIGCIGLQIGNDSHLHLSTDEGELGYWIGEPFWGQGLIPEGVKEVIRYGFQTLALNCLWCCYFDGNEQSHRVQEKCGFAYHHTMKNALWEITQDIRTEHVTCLSKNQWELSEKEVAKKQL